MCKEKIFRQVAKKSQGSDLREMLVEDVSAQLQGKRKFFGDVRNANPQFIKSKNVFLFLCEGRKKTFSFKHQSTKIFISKDFLFRNFPFFYGSMEGA
jgi:hypothetical protein